MANEISVSGSMSVSNGELTDNRSYQNTTIDQTTAGMVRNTQLIPTSNTALALGGVSSVGVARFKNMDATNFIDIGLTGSYFIRLLAGEEYGPIRLAGSPYALADTGSVELDYTIYEA